MARSRSSTSPPLPTATVSVCVAPDEHDTIRRAAALAELAVSPWAYSRVLAAYVSTKARSATRDAAAELPSLRAGARSGRVSMVMKPADRDGLAAAAKLAGMTVHAFAQVALITAAAREVGGAPPTKLARGGATMQARVKAAAAAAPAGTAVRVPSAVKAKDLDMVATLVGAALNQVGDKAYAGEAPTIHDGMSRMMARLDADPAAGWTMIVLDVPRIELQIVAGMLRLPVETVATVLAVKAARAL